MNLSAAKADEEVDVEKVAETIKKIDWSEVWLNIGWTAVKLVIIYILFIMVKKLGNKLIDGVFERYRRHDPQAEGRAKTLEGLTKNILSYVLVFIFFVTVLQIFHIKTTGILAGAGIVGLAVGFGAQGLVSDFVTGFFILLERQMDVGDKITTGSYTGTVEQLGLRTTQIRDCDGTLHFILNRNITSVSNHSRGNMRAMIDLTIPAKDDVQHAIGILQHVCNEFAKENTEVVETPQVIGVEKLDGDNVTVRIVCKAVNGKQFDVERKLRLILNSAMKENGLDKA